MSALTILTKCPLANSPLAKCPLAKCLDTLRKVLFTVLKLHVRTIICPTWLFEYANGRVSGCTPVPVVNAVLSV